MAIAVGTAFVLGMIYMIILRCCAGVIIFLSLMGILAMLAGGGCWIYFIGRYKYQETEDNFKYMTYGAYTIWGIGGAYLIILLCLCNRIRLGVAIIKCTSDFIRSTWSVFLIPIFFVIATAVWITAWLFTAVFIFSVGELTYRDAPFQFLSTVKWE